MTAPTPGDTYALIAARQRQQAIDAAKASIAEAIDRYGKHDPVVDLRIARLADLIREDT